MPAQVWNDDARVFLFLQSIAITIKVGPKENQEIRVGAIIITLPALIAGLLRQQNHTIISHA